MDDIAHKYSLLSVDCDWYHGGAMHFLLMLMLMLMVMLLFHHLYGVRCEALDDAVVSMPRNATVAEVEYIVDTIGTHI